MAQGISFYDSDSITTSQTVNAIREDIKRILLTSPGERPNNVAFGSRFKEFIFEDELTIDGELQSEVYNCIARWEPRVNILAISVIKTDAFNRGLSITFQIKETGEVVPMELNFQQ